MSRFERWLPVVLFLFSLITRLIIVSAAQFDGLYGQDAYAYFEYARQIAEGELAGSFYWPLGYPMLAALFMRLTGAVPLGAQLASAITGSAIAPLVYLITRKLTPSNTHTSLLPVSAGLLASLSGQLLQSSISIMADAPALFWATLSAYALIHFDQTRQAEWLPISAASLALAIITRWIFAGLIFPLGVFAVLSLRHSSSPNHPFTLSPRLLISLSSALVIFSLILLPQIIFSQFSSAPVTSHAWLVEWNPLNAFKVAFDNPDGHFDYRWPPLIFYAEPLFHPFYLFPILTPFVFIGAWHLRRSRYLILLGGWILTLYLYLIGIPYENFRFGLAFYPPIVALTTLGLAVVRFSYTPALPHTFSLSPRLRISHSPLFLVFISIVAALPFTARGLFTFFSVKSRELAAARYLQAQAAPNATVLTFSLTLTLKHYTNLNVVDLYEQSPDTLRSIICTASPAYLYVESENIKAQWVGKSPALNLNWLRDEIGLYEIGREGTWSLFAVEHGCRNGAKAFVTLVHSSHA